MAGKIKGQVVGPGSGFGRAERGKISMARGRFSSGAMDRITISAFWARSCSSRESKRDADPDAATRAILRAEVGTLNPRPKGPCRLSSSPGSHVDGIGAAA